MNIDDQVTVTVYDLPDREAEPGSSDDFYTLRIGDELVSVPTADLIAALRPSAGH